MEGDVLEILLGLSFHNFHRRDPEHKGQVVASIEHLPINAAIGAGKALAAKVVNDSVELWARVTSPQASFMVAKLDLVVPMCHTARWI